MQDPVKYFITGATGFIGSHLTKTLVRQGKDITMLINRTFCPDYCGQNRESLKTVRVDLLDSCKLAQEMVIHDTDVVVHLAYESSGTPDEQRQVQVEGTKNVLRAAIETKVKRFIHISTISVYGEPPKNKTYTEDTPRYASLGLYPQLKQEAELAVLNLPRKGTEVVVLQPGIVYGPGGRDWTEALLKIFKEKLFPLVNGGQGLCNLIHVDDLVDAIILAATVPGIDGECFIVTNDKPVTWAAFLGSYEKILAKKCLISIPTPMMKQYNVWKRASGKVQEYRFYTRVLRKLFKFFQFPYIHKPIQFIDNERIDFFAAKPYFSNQKAKKLLGFKPKIELEEGMGKVKKWVEKSNFFDKNL